MNFRSSIAIRLPIVVGGLALLVAAALSWAAYREVKATTVTVATQRLANVAGEIAAQLGLQARAQGRRLHYSAREPAMVAWLREPGPATARRARLFLDSISSSDSATRSWRLTTISGDTLVAGVIPPGPAAPAGDSVTVGPIFTSGDTTVYTLSAAVAQQGQPLGRLELWRRSYPTPFTRDQLAALAGEGATFLIGSDSGGWSDLMTPGTKPALELARDTGFMLVGDPVAGSRFAVVRRVPGSPWHVVMWRPEGPVMAAAHSFLTRITVVGVVLSLFALAVAWWQGKRITAPLRDFTSATMAMSGADYSQRVNVPGTDELSLLAVTFNAMAERVEDEVAARRRSEEQWHRLFAGNPLPMWVVDEDTLRFLAVNDACVRHYGYSEAEFLAMSLGDIRVSEGATPLRQAMDEASKVHSYTAGSRHRRKDGTVIDVDVTANAITFVGRRARLALCQDVTARRMLENELRQAQKMEAVGRLAAGVAHDFNNVLAVILTHAELLRDDHANNHAVTAETGEIIKAGQHAHTLTRQLLAFSRQQVVRPQVLDLNKLIGRLETLVRPVIGAGVEMRLKLDPAAGSVSADPAQIEQVLLNLVINARDAMPRGGTLTIETGGAEKGGQPFVTLTVRDTGIGMDEEVKSRVFEPFYTTKGEGKGTGLGLASVYGIATQAGGAVTVESTPRKGSSFVVWLPRVSGEQAETVRPAAGGALRGTETILLAEDEPAVRAVVHGILKRYGYTVLVAGDGKQALELAATAGNIDLLLTDVVMPGLTGPALLDTLRETRPALRGLFMSGYAGDSVREHGLQDSTVPFIEKPFSVAALAEKVREALK